MSFLSPLLRLSGLMAALLFVLAVLGFGAGLDGYAQARHPVALLGAHGVPHALAFNLLGFVLPGLLAAVVAECLRRRLPATAGWAPRVGSQMLLLAGLAFAAMGLLPLDVDDLHGPASQLHASAWMIWVLGFVAGTLLLGMFNLRQAHGRAQGGLAVACGVLAAVAAFALQGQVPAPLAQRLAFACWALWLAVALPLSRPR
ncbi:MULTISPECIES: DUF998 domain-containing protein [unclassified Stenotrophomonas]|uniref:DUF998 domain-containing protein n=1 Tax=unclassified Stenotrophomonas TaxID=196198 RepID=UPI000D161074|nr:MULTISPECIES: DUF998 domain-containing protein [unclassified Stenotrophomonas]PTA72444.1 DUF998 domain-containing protein [Stenotrophomonas sp. Nf1]PTA81093.1 DUF998 domain-containing protein [Stenotrophomonas sp. Nf4]